MWFKRSKTIEIAKGIELEQFRNPKKGTVLHIAKDIKSIGTYDPEGKLSFTIPGTKITIEGERKKKRKLFKK